MNWYYHTLNPEVGEALAEVKKTNVAKLPMLSLKEDDRRLKRVVALCSAILDLCSPSSRTNHERTVIERQIEATDRQIDQLVYELYGLTDGEIAMVESSVK